jgi:DNA-binding transcriptional MerR regulator
MKLDFTLNKIAEWGRHSYELTECRILGSELSLSVKKLNTWNEQGLLHEKIESGKWRTFNFYEACWVIMVDELRTFGLSINVIKKVKESLFELVSKDIWEDETIQRRILEKTDKETAEMLIQSLLSADYKKMNNGVLDTKWGFLLAGCMMSRSSYDIYINSFGEIFPVSENFKNDTEFLQDKGLFSLSSYLVISLVGIIAKVITIPSFDSDQFLKNIVSDNEFVFLQKIKTAESIKDLKVVLSEKYKNLEIDLLLLGKDPHTALVTLTEIIIKKEYSEVKVRIGNSDNYEYVYNN